MEPIRMILNEKRDEEYPKDIKDVAEEPSKRYKPQFV